MNPVTMWLLPEEIQTMPAVIFPPPGELFKGMTYLTAQSQTVTMYVRALLAVHQI